MRLVTRSVTQEQLGSDLSITAVLDGARQHGRKARAKAAAGIADEIARRRGQAARAGPGQRGGRASGREPSQQLSPLAASAARRGSNDPVVGAFFAGVLAAVSKRKGHEAKLVAEGAVEALVLLANASLRGEGKKKNTAAQGRDPPAKAAAGAAGKPEGSTSPDGDVDESGGAPDEARDISRLRPSCALGLFNLASAPDPAVRRRVIEGGAPAVFARLASEHNEVPRTRRLCLLGLCHLAWGAAPADRKRVLAAGAAQAAVLMVTGPAS